MASNIDFGSILRPDARVPLNVSSLLHLIQNRQDDFAIRLTDVLRQTQNSIELIWRLLKQEFPEITTIELLGPDGETKFYIGLEYLQIKSLTTAAFMSAGPNSIGIQEDTDQFDAIVGGDSVAVNLTRNGNTDITIQTTPSGVTIALASGAKIMFNGVQVLTNQQATVNAVTLTAGATYTANEQNLINDLKAKVNDLRSRLQAHGIIA